MVRIKKGVIEAWKRGKLGQKQMDLKEFQVKKKVEKLTYSQDWTNYNKAKCREKTICMELLLELLDIVGEPKRLRKPRHDEMLLKEKLVSMFIYCFNGFSTRKCIADIELAKRAGLLHKTPHFNSICNWFKDTVISSKLMEMIEISALPLRMFEDHLSVDSSGFSCASFEQWLNIRTQKPSKLRKWLKAHLIVGTLTNVVCSLSITEANKADSPQLIPLVRRVAKFYNPSEISADKAYSSRENLKTISSLGSIPYIPFRKNVTGKPKGYQIWSTMFTYFWNNQEEFLKHYHQRSNVESTFHMIKRNFGNKLKMKTFNSQVTEILMKCLCHNLTVLVQESFERGLEIDFVACADYYVAQQDG